MTNPERKGLLARFTYGYLGSIEIYLKDIWCTELIWVGIGTIIGLL